MATHYRTTPLFRRLAMAAVMASLVAATAGDSLAQIVQQQVGGILIGPDGVVRRTRVEDAQALRQLRQQALEPVASDLQAPALRKVSLRGLEAAIAEQRKHGTALSDDIRYLAGLTRIQYVLVYPDEHDIVLAGPGEGWKIDGSGEVVGAKSGRPVYLLDDLVVALRSSQKAREQGISCSIDPTPEGLSRLQSYLKQVHAVGSDPSMVMAAIEERLGPQMVSVGGVPETSHFARVMVAADFRMKRLAMAFEEIPIAALPSFLHMMQTARSTPKSMLPRWWLEPRYDAIVRDAEGLAWEIPACSVQALTEEEVVNASGKKEKAARANPLAKTWADKMTAHYDELALKEPIFGQLRNCIDLSVVAALLDKEGLAEKAGCKLELLTGGALPVEAYHAPRSVDSQASALQKGTDWIISASGGVMIVPTEIVERTTTKAQLTGVRTKAATRGGSWWWN